MSPKLSEQNHSTQEVSPRPRLIIFDFDGTLTDAEQEGAPFRTGYLDDISVLTGWKRDRVEHEAALFEREVSAHPERYGWLFSGEIVAPATVDPYLRMMPVARELLDRANALMTSSDRERVLDGLLYKYNYQKTVTAFRDGINETLQTLMSGGFLGEGAGELYIVTNSHTDAVQGKVMKLEAERATTGKGRSLAPLVDRVYGRAKKYIVDPDFEVVSTSISLPGLDRPVLLRRKHYYEVLNQLRTSANVDWSDVWVFGDIFELDLCLPLSLGASVGLMTNPFTPNWERDFLTSHPRGHLLSSLSQVGPLLGL